MANTLSDAIARLAPAKKPKGRLPEPAAREALPISITEVGPIGAAATTGDGAPVEVTAYSITSSDGLFVLAGFKATDGAFYAEEPPVV